MTATPAAAAITPAAAPLRLRVRICAADGAAARRLAERIVRSGHVAVGPKEPADVVLSDGAVPGATDLPGVMLGAGGDEFTGILAADPTPAQLDAALRAAAAGLVVRSKSPSFASRVGFAPLPEAPAQPLTPREVEVLTALADGLGNKAVARRLGISPHTVKFHLESLFRKLGVATRAEAVAKGLRAQIVEF